MENDNTYTNVKSDLYILDISKLQLGDIILESGDSWYSSGIRIATNSHYSHAKFYWSSCSCIEALSDGVHSSNPKRTLYKSPNDVKVMRYKGDISPYIDMIINYIRDKIGAPYSKLLAINTKIPLFTDDDRKQFCSKLIGLAFHHAGINITEEPSICTPADIELSQKFLCIENCLLKATDDDIAFANSKSFLEIQKESTNFIISECSRLSNEKFFSLNDIERFLIKNKSFDYEFSCILKKSGYLTLMEDYEIPKNRYRYDDQALDEMLGKCSNIDIINEYKIQKDLYSRHLSSYKNMAISSKQFNLEYFNLNNDLYRRLTQIHYQSAKRFLDKINDSDFLNKQ